MKTIESKIVVLGAQGVGKTSVVLRYVGKLFSKHVSPTIGASFFSCKMMVEDTKVKMQVWDTAGQERFRSMAPLYYRNANAAIFVFDITCYSSFCDVQSWVKELQRNMDEPIVMCVIGNKTDLQTERVVGKQIAQEYANSIGSLYFETSALADEGIEEAFFEIALHLIRLGEEELVNSKLRMPLMDASLNSSRENSGILLEDEETEVQQRRTERSVFCC